LLLAGLVAPHREHVIGNPDPHCVQKRFVCGLSALQLTHFIEGALYNGRWSGGARGRGLLRLDIGLTNNFTPFLRFIGMNLAKSAGEPASAVAPHSGRQALTWESSKPALTALLSVSTISGGKPFSPAMPV
jgi:hypothetical protein